MRHKGSEGDRTYLMREAIRMAISMINMALSMAINMAINMANQHAIKDVLIESFY